MANVAKFFWGIVAAVAVLLAVPSCDWVRYPRALVEADSLAESNPREALAKLRGLAGDTASMPRSHLMYYRLLRLKAEDKAYIEHKSDSIARLLVDHYEGRGDRRLLPQAYYYAASVYRDLHDAPQALDYFHKAAAAIPDDGDLRLKSYAYNQMGKLFMFQDLNDHALRYFHESYRLDSIRKDTFDMVAALCDMSVPYQDMGDLKNCYLCLRLAQRLNAQAGLKSEFLIFHRMSVIFLQSGKADSAWLYIQKPLAAVRNVDSSAVLSVAAKAGFATGRLDSAYILSRKLLQIGTVYAKQTASKIMAEVCFRRGRIEEGLLNISRYELFSDSIAKLDARQAVANADALYDYQIRERQNLQLKIENRNYLMAFLAVAILFSIIVIVLIVRDVKSMDERQRLKIQIFVVQRLEEEYREKSDNKISKMMAELGNVRHDLRDVTQSKSELENELYEQKEKLRAAIEGNRQQAELRKERDAALLKSVSYSLLHEKVCESKPISISEWKQIEAEVDTVLPEFKSILYQAYELSELEYHICLLIKMGFKNNEISSLVSRTPNAVSQARKRLYFKITGKDGSPADLDAIVKSL